MVQFHDRSFLCFLCSLLCALVFASTASAQFAMPGAVDRLRAHRAVSSDEEGTVFVLAATDPAQPYGAALPWPEHGGRPARAWSPT